MSNPVTRFQILSKTPDETGAFYTRLFGWRVNSDNALGYREIDTGSKEGIQGGIWPAPPQAPSFVQLFVSVADVKGTVGKAQELGAKLIIPPTMLPDGDEMAVLHDPTGLPFAVWHARRESR
jgi:predicted enzyme related to lactoylglutathione lyase